MINNKTTLPKWNKVYELWLFRLALIGIVLFSIFLRYEDFSVWKKQKSNFQYEGEYQMANFDSYYYLNIAKELQEGNYDGFQENRRVPNGMESPFVPPLISVTAATISTVTGIPLSTVAIFLPIFLASLLAPLIFLICIRLKFNKISALTAALFSITSLTYVIRTRIGVFDTDCLNVIFVLLNSYLFFCFAEIKNNKRYTYLGLSILNSFLFFIWWNTATSIVVLSAVVPLSVALIFFYKTKKAVVKYAVLTSIILLSFYLIKDEIILIFNLVLDKTNAAFPKNLSISELNAVSMSSFIKRSTGNAFIFYSMLLGLVTLVWKLKLKALFFAIPFLIAVLPFVTGNRFILFSAPVLALGIGYCIQMLFTFKKKINQNLAIGITLVIVIIGISSNYKTITDKYVKPAAFNNVVLLKALDKYTPKEANIWTDWDLGYQIQYYLDRGTYSDGGFSDGEISYYAAYPFATDNLNVSANFMRFYNKHGIKGMNVLYKSINGVDNTFNFLYSILSLHPSEAEAWFTAKQIKNKLPKTPDLTTPQQWVSFLFPKQSDDIYLFIHYKMTQTVAWFKQGNSDLKTGETIGLPLFFAFHNLKQQNNQIGNNQINLNTTTGIANYQNQKKYFRSLSTFDGKKAETKSFAKNARINNVNDNRFVFQWNKKIGFGSAMSKEMANTTFVKLYLMQEKSPHFEPVVINTPQYQIWKVTGNAYETIEE